MCFHFFIVFKILSCISPHYSVSTRHPSLSFTSASPCTITLPRLPLYVLCPSPVPLGTTHIYQDAFQNLNSNLCGLSIPLCFGVTEKGRGGGIMSILRLTLVFHFSHAVFPPLDYSSLWRHTLVAQVMAHYSFYFSLVGTLKCECSPSSKPAYRFRWVFLVLFSLFLKRLWHFQIYSWTISAPLQMCNVRLHEHPAEKLPWKLWDKQRF